MGYRGLAVGMWSACRHSIVHLSSLPCYVQGLEAESLSFLAGVMV